MLRMRRFGKLYAEELTYNGIECILFIIRKREKRIYVEYNIKRERLMVGLFRKNGGSDYVI
jgi:hypothetical protein